VHDYTATLNDQRQGMADMSKRFIDMGAQVYVDQAAVVKESNKAL
jgi:phosphomethylpyrimidine synthase